MISGLQQQIRWNYKFFKPEILKNGSKGRQEVEKDNLLAPAHESLPRETERVCRDFQGVREIFHIKTERRSSRDMAACKSQKLFLQGTARVTR